MGQHLYEAARFRLQPADPTADGTITITRETFNRLLAVVDAACKANWLEAGCDELVARCQDGEHIVVLRSKVVGDVQAKGRSLIEAIANARRKFHLAVERRLL